MALISRLLLDLEPFPYDWFTNKLVKLIIIDKHLLVRMGT